MAGKKGEKENKAASSAAAMKKATAAKAKAEPKQKKSAKNISGTESPKENKSTSFELPADPNQRIIFLQAMLKKEADSKQATAASQAETAPSQKDDEDEEEAEAPPKPEAKRRGRRPASSSNKNDEPALVPNKKKEKVVKDTVPEVSEEDDVQIELSPNTDKIKASESDKQAAAKKMSKSKSKIRSVSKMKTEENHEEQPSQEVEAIETPVETEDITSEKQEGLLIVEDSPAPATTSHMEEVIIQNNVIISKKTFADDNEGDTKKKRARSNDGEIEAEAKRNKVILDRVKKAEQLLEDPKKVKQQSPSKDVIILDSDGDADKSVKNIKSQKEAATKKRNVFSSMPDSDSEESSVLSHSQIEKSKDVVLTDMSQAVVDKIVSAYKGQVLPEVEKMIADVVKPLIASTVEIKGELRKLRSQEKERASFINSAKPEMEAIKTKNNVASSSQQATSKNSVFPLGGSENNSIFSRGSSGPNSSVFDKNNTKNSTGPSNPTIFDKNTLDKNNSRSSQSNTGGSTAAQNIMNLSRSDRFRR
jgi:hypothetical protein